MQFEYELINAMSQWDLNINSINLEPGKYHRFRSIGTCKTKCCEYRVFENQLGAHFKCFRRGIDRFWFAKDLSKVTQQENLAMQQERDRITKAKLRAQTLIKARCARFWSNLTKRSELPRQHPYVLRKGIYPHAALNARGMIVLPVQTIFGDIQSLQFIKSNGFKQFKTGAPTTEGMIWLSRLPPLDYQGVIRLCEGWSTGCTIYSITKSPVVCALNAWNLIKVAVLFRRIYQHAMVKICADNDIWGKENVGLNCAKEAALYTGYTLHYPTFDQVADFNKPTDFNDLFLLGGAELTIRQLKITRSAK